MIRDRVMPNAPRRRARIALGLGLSLWLAGIVPACNGGIAVLGSDPDTIYQNEERGYRIRHPRAAGNAWQRTSVDGADLAFRRPNAGGDATLTLLSRCRVGSAMPMILARHLLIGIPDRHLRQAGPAVVDTLPAWTQTFDIVEPAEGDAQSESSPIRVKTVTVRSADCLYDFVLTCRGAFLATERQFDSWWRSFELDAVREARGSAGPEAAGDAR